MCAKKKIDLLFLSWSSIEHHIERGACGTWSLFFLLWIPQKFHCFFVWGWGVNTVHVCTLLCLLAVLSFVSIHYHLSTGAEQTQDLSTKHLKVCPSKVSKAKHWTMSIVYSHTNAVQKQNFWKQTCNLFFTFISIHMTQFLFWAKVYWSHCNHLSHTDGLNNCWAKEPITLELSSQLLIFRRLNDTNSFDLSAPTIAAVNIKGTSYAHPLLSCVKWLC